MIQEMEKEVEEESEALAENSDNPAMLASSVNMNFYSFSRPNPALLPLAQICHGLEAVTH